MEEMELVGISACPTVFRYGKIRYVVSHIGFGVAQRGGWLQIAINFSSGESCIHISGSERRIALL